MCFLHMSRCCWERTSSFRMHYSTALEYHLETVISYCRFCRGSIFREDPSFPCLELSLSSDTCVFPRLFVSPPLSLGKTGTVLGYLLNSWLILNQTTLPMRVFSILNGRCTRNSDLSLVMRWNSYFPGSLPRSIINARAAVSWTADPCCLSQLS